MLTLSAETSRLVSTHCLHPSIFHSQWFRVEQELYFFASNMSRPAITKISAVWKAPGNPFANKSWLGRPMDRRRNTYRICGLPGIGKTSLAPSICASLHDQGQLAGAFFCQKDILELSEPEAPFRLSSINSRSSSLLFEASSQCLRKDPNITPESMKRTLFLDFIRELTRSLRSLIFVIDHLMSASAHRVVAAPRVVQTSRRFSPVRPQILRGLKSSSQ